MSKEYEIRDGYYGVQYYDKDGNEGKFIPKGLMVSIRAYLYSIETDYIAYALTFPTKIDTIGRHEISSFDLYGKQTVDAALVNKGADISQQTLACFRECFRILESENNYPTINTYRYVGFQSVPVSDTDEATASAEDSREITPVVPEVLIYKSNNLIAPSEISNYKGEYKGNLDLFKHGTFAGWVDFINNEVVPHSKLLAVFLGSACAITTGVIGNKKQFTNPIFHLYGMSSTGKSCAAKVAASIYGRPSDDTSCYDGKIFRSVYGSWAGTENAIRDYCAGNHGVSIILNELGKSPIKDLTLLLYSFSEGTSKSRSSAEGEVHQLEGYRTSFISVGEFSVFDRCDRFYEGLDYRIMEIKAPFTVDAAHAKRLEQLSYDNCGHAAEIMASYILDHGGQAMVEALYDKYYERFEAKITQLSALSNRFLSSFAAPLLTTAELANTAWGINIDIDGVEIYLLQYLHQKEVEENLSESHFNTIVELCLRNKGMFICKGLLNTMSANNAKDVWGKLEQVQSADSSFYRIWLHRTQLEKLCKDNNMPSAKTCMSAWKEHGWVETEKDRLEKRDNKKVSYYVLIAKDILCDGMTYKTLSEEKILKYKEENNEDNDCA